MKLQDLQTPETLGRFSKQIDLNSSGSTMNEKDPRKVNGAGFAGATLTGKRSRARVKTSLNKYVSVPASGVSKGFFPGGSNSGEISFHQLRD